MLGATLVRDDPAGGGRRCARIVELEAYGGPTDQASHARMGRTDRNAVMFGPAGIAYVYLVYGMYDCLNVVMGPDGEACALLIRAVLPVEGADRMRAARIAWHDTHRKATTAADHEREAARVARLPNAALASGPGLVGAAFGLDRSWTGVDLLDPASNLRIEGPLGSVTPDRIVTGPRIGVAYAGEPWVSLPWRLAIADEPAVSRPRPAR